MTELLRQDQARAGEDDTALPTLAPDKIDKSQLAVAEPKRLRDKAHLNSWPPNRVWYAGDNHPIRITCALRNHERSV